MISARRSLAYGLTALVLGALTTAAASRVAVGQPRPYDLDSVPTAGALRWTSLGHPTLAANLYWLRAVQYVGDPAADRRGWDKLFPVLELLTDLDPRHGYAYQVGGNILGSVGRVDESNAIFEKGTQHVPDRYILPFQRAVNAFLYEGDYALAGRWFEQAARTPGAPEHLREYVAAMYVKGNAPDAAVSFLSHLYSQAEDDESRKALRKQLDQALLERDALALEALAERYRDRHGVRPIALEQLLLDGLVAAIPPDPYGGAYYLDGEGRVRSPANPRRYERPLSEREREANLRVPQRRFDQLRAQTR